MRKPMGINEAIKVLSKRRDFLERRIEDKKTNGSEWGFDRSESNALKKALEVLLKEREHSGASREIDEFGGVNIRSI